MRNGIECAQHVKPLPAGLEIVNPALAVSETITQDPTSSDYRYGDLLGKSWLYPWYEHQNMRDNRAEAFTSLLWDGVYEYTYNARATTPGTFIVPPLFPHHPQKDEGGDENTPQGAAARVVEAVPYGMISHKGTMLQSEKHCERCYRRECPPWKLEKEIDQLVLRVSCP